MAMPGAAGIHLYNFVRMKLPFTLLCALALCACEKNINFNLKQVANVVVVDANIENGRPPVVILSKSFSYFSRINPAALDTSFIHDAGVFITDGGQTQQLKEYSAGVPGLSVYYYSTDTATAGTPFSGKLNTAYNLKVITGGQEYEATTTIPGLSKKIDSLWWKPTPFADDSSQVDVFVKSTDPPGLGNYIRYYTSTGNGPFLPGAQSVFDDQLIDGTTYNLKLTPGIDRNDPVAFDKNFFHRGDTVTLKLSNIDRNTYEFWLTMEFAYQSIGNPFASPNTVLGNISNGGLGAFCGYASSFKTLYIPK